MCVYMGELT